MKKRLHKSTARRSRQGFTLIELLVVISIIGILATIGTIVFDNVRKNARDNQRKADLAKIQTALETYFLRNNKYPPEDGGCDSSIGEVSSNCCYTAGTSCPFQDNWDTTKSDLWGGLITEEKILAALPKDPINKWPYYYRYEQDDENQGSPKCEVNACRYILLTLLENGELSNGSHGKCIYAVRGGGGKMQNTRQTYRWDDLDSFSDTYYEWCKDVNP